ncbi:MAG: hypothetical protein IT460_16590 [Planctomycetes bacterium]|nr:hypothetical protein [Planctomycetota bacterium]
MTTKRRARWLGAWVTLGVVAAVLSAGVGAALAGEPEAEALPNIVGEPLPLLTPDEMEAWIAQQAPRTDGTLDYVKECVRGALEKGPPGCGSFGNHMARVVAATLPAAAYLGRASFEHAEAIFAKDPANAEAYFVRPLAVAVLLGQRKDQTPEVVEAAAYARLAHAWSRFLAGVDVDSVRVVQAAQAVGAATSAPPPDAWARFVRAALRASALRSDDRLARWAEGERDRLAKAAPDDPAWKPSVGDALAKAVRLAEYEEAGAAAALKAVLLAPETVAAVSADRGLAGLFNRAVTRARALKLGLKVGYVTDERRTASGVLAFDVPRACGWKPQEVDGEQEEGTWVRDRGVSDLSELRVWKYSTSVDYVGEGGKTIGGDNVGARMRKYFEADKASLVKTKKATPTIARLSKRVPDGRGYEVRGEDDLGHDVWYREWYFKPEGSPGFVVVVSMRREGVILDPDPEIDAILESMREP